MQSGYGGVSEIQQFMMDVGCPSSLFSISTAPPNATSPSATAEIHHASQKFNPLPHPHHHQHHHPHHQSPPHFQHQHTPPHFTPFGHPFPITQQLFQQTHHHQHNHQFQLFHHHQQHLGPDQDSGPETSNSPAGGGPSFLAAMNFKVGLNESSGGGVVGSGDGFNEDDGILQGDDGSESRLHHSWHREEESAAANFKEPFWRPLDIDYMNPNNKRPAKDKQPAKISSNVKHFKKSNEAALDHIQPSNNNNKNANTEATTASNYKLFSELEAIYNPSGTPTSGGGRPTGANNQTGSGASALTSDDNPLMPAAGPGHAVEHHQPDNVSDTSNGGEAPPQPVTNKLQQKVKSKRSKRARQQKQLASIAAFFESLVKQLMDHQEELHHKFLEVMERRDQGRTNREEAWQKQEAAKANRESAARAQERALAAAREAAIISFLEKITGESINLPSKAQFTDESQQKGQQHDAASLEPQNALEPYNADSANNNNIGGGVIQLSFNRWPEAEVRALIRVRSGLETRFQEPGLKGPLWEEVSLAMAGLGYQRSAKRCKEKWENINKYFRKTKDSGKKRPQQSKACHYFHQLDQLYSKSLSNAANAAATSVTPSSSNANVNEERKENSELLDAIVVSNEVGKWSNAEFNEDEEEGGGEDEGQGESQEQGQGCDNIKRDHGHHHRQQLQLSEGEQDAQRDSAHFYHRLRT